jgi:hypothetical protein
MASTASSSLNKSINYEDHEENTMKRQINVETSQSDLSEMERPELLCCGNKSLPKVFLLIFGLGAFVGFIDYFLVKNDLNKRHRGDKTKYDRLANLGVAFDSTFEEYVAHFGKSYSKVDEYKARKSLFEASKAEIKLIQASDGASSTYTMELNEFADMTDKEFKTFWTGGKPLDERIDSHSVFYDFEAEVEIDSLYIQKYLEDMETNPHFADDHGTLDESIEEIVPDNHYGPIGDDVLDNPFDKIGEESYDEASRNIEDMEFEESLNKDKHYEMDDYVKLDQDPIKRRNLGIWPFEAIKPLELDWRSEGAVSRVKRQGRCGACWAIAAAGALEGANAIHTDKLVEMSEQQILDCASMEPFRSVKCDGGYISEALRYAKTSLIATRENYPYLGFNNTCRQISENDLKQFRNIPALT